MTTSGGLDVIGDVHGQYEVLVRLLTRLGYARRDGAWRHPDRQAVFVGDLIDRGPEQVAVVTLVREMHDAGTALVAMGNHEWNALAWVTQRPDHPGEFLRDNNDKNKRLQHADFLAQVGEGSALHHEYLAWFTTLPLWLDLPGLRVVHACWQPAQIAHVAERTNGSCRVTPDLLERAHIKHSADYRAIETLLKGIEVALPEPMTFVDKSGHRRHQARIQWWRPAPRTFRNSAIVEGNDVRAQLPDIALPDAAVIEVDTDPRPVVFGHYWATGSPTLLSNKAVCVDYSASMVNGSLVAYRWSGETELVEANLVSVPGATNKTA